MKFLIVLFALMAFAAAQLLAGPNVRTTITGPDGGQIIKDDFTGSVFKSNLVYPAPTVPLVRYGYGGRYAHYPFVNSLYPSYYRFY